MADTEIMAGGWVDSDTVRVASFTRMRTRPRKVAMYQDGSMHYVDGVPDEVLLPKVALDNGKPLIRDKVQCPYAQTYIVSATDLLEGPYDLPIDRVPVFRVPGWEITVEEKRHRWGMVRFLKDPQRYLNYWRSVRAEKLLQTPRAKWLARKNAVQGIEKQYRESHLSDDPLLTFNDEAAEPPKLMQPAQMEPAISEESDRNKQVLKDVSNIHEASLGQQSNEVSGKAIVARQRVGELGSVIFIDNENMAIEELGRVANQLIPYVYSGARTIKILGPDDKAVLQVINTQGNDASVDISAGKYAVTVTTGPSYVTKRLEARESMETVFNASPQTMAPMLDLWFEAFDFPGSDKMAERARKMLPPGMLSQDELTPEEQQAQQVQQQVAQIQQRLTANMATIQLSKAQAEVDELEAHAELFRAQARAVGDNTHIKAAAEDTKARSTQLNDSITAISAAHEGEGKSAQGAS
jgi:hypothetical protein